jgi:hypothetical protein
MLCVSFDVYDCLVLHDNLKKKSWLYSQSPLTESETESRIERGTENAKEIGTENGTETYYVKNVGLLIDNFTYLLCWQ